MMDTSAVGQIKHHYDETLEVEKLDFEQEPEEKPLINT